MGLKRESFGWVVVCSCGNRAPKAEDEKGWLPSAQAALENAADAFFLPKRDGEEWICPECIEKAQKTLDNFIALQAEHRKERAK